MRNENRRNKKQRARLSRFTILASVVFISTAIVDYSFAQTTIPWPQNSAVTTWDQWCNFYPYYLCDVTGCTGYGWHCGSTNTAYQLYIARRPWGDSCIPSDPDRYCFFGTIWFCAYTLHLDTDSGCTTPICWFFLGTSSGCG
jgi:hypothetical protein